MKKPIDQILPNPHRNFDIYPIGETQVALLMESISEVGMFLGLPARKTQNGYEIACGHHRLEALKRTGATHVDIAVNDYSDDEMLKIMIRENSTQRGNENFGAVLDSVGAVLVQCVRDVYGSLIKGSAKTREQSNLENGTGIGRETILAKEPSFAPRHAQHSLETFRSTGTYLTLLKKGGLPEQFWHLYEVPPTTNIEAVAMFPKPAHAAAWVKGVDNDMFKDRFGIESHTAMVADILKVNDRAVTVLEINEYIRHKINPNINLNPDEKEQKSLDEKADDVTKAVKALLTKTEKFLKEKGDKDCTIDNIDPIIDMLIEQLELLKEARNQTTITIR